MVAIPTPLKYVAYNTNSVRFVPGLRELVPSFKFQLLNYSTDICRLETYNFNFRKSKNNPLLHSIRDITNQSWAKIKVKLQK